MKLNIKSLRFTNDALPMRLEDAVPPDSLLIAPRRQLELAWLEMHGIVDPTERFEPKKCALITNIGPAFDVGE
jgi:hypothetical protein